MFASILRRYKGALHLQQYVRYLSVQETAAALRPFYFIVHPDLFGQYPKERSVNEESLKILHEYVTSLQKTGSARPRVISFYVRSQDDDTSNNSDPHLKTVQISLASKDLRTTVSTVLKSCGLPLNYLNTVAQRPRSKRVSFDESLKWDVEFYSTSHKRRHPDDVPQQPELTLGKWLQRNIQKSRAQEDAVRVIQDDIQKLCDGLVSSLALKGLRWDSVWGFSHFRGCLKSFYRMYQEHPERVGNILRGRSLVFSNKTGVSLHGDIVLSSEDVPTYWMTLLISVRAYDAVLERLPYMEKKLSELLNDIQIVRRKHSHHLVMAEEYELLLNKLLNSLRRCQDKARTSLFQEDLSHLELVVEGESGPLALSSTGQFLIPASIPGSIVIDFIVKHKKEAHTILRNILRCLKKENDVVEECRRYLKLSKLTKDETVTPGQMVTCCHKLLHESWMFGISLENSKLRVSHYYSVMQDGEICIPWNWEGDTNA